MNEFGLLDYVRMFRKKGIRLPLNYFFENHFYDLVHKTDTHARIEKEKFIDRPESFEHGVLYMCSWTSVVKKATELAVSMSHLSPNEVCFIDIGCGKGKVLCIWEEMFREYQESIFLGIDYSKSLLAVCKNNLNLLNAKKTELFCGDILTFDFEKFCTQKTLFLYMYNPFDSVIVGKVLDKLKNRKVFIIYNNPVHDQIIVSKGFEKIYEDEKWHPNATFSIYRS